MTSTSPGAAASGLEQWLDELLPQQGGLGAGARDASRRDIGERLRDDGEDMYRGISITSQGLPHGEAFIEASPILSSARADDGGKEAALTLAASVYESGVESTERETQRAAHRETEKQALTETHTEGAESGYQSAVEGEYLYTDIP